MRHFRRRLLVAGLTAPFFARTGNAQQGKVWRIGFFYGGSLQSALDTGRYQAFLQGMRELGYAENTNFVVVARHSEGPENALAFAKQLLASEPDVIVVSGGAPLQALQKLNATVPIVVAVSVDPVRQGIAENLARPGKNFTGLSAVLSDLFPKHVEVIKAAAPRTSRLAILMNPQNATHAGLARRVTAAAQENRMRAQLVKVGAHADLTPAFADMQRQRAEALLMLGDSFFVQHFSEIAKLTLQHRLISTYSGREYPEVGGLLSYGPNFRDHYRRTASFIDKILKGTKPGDMPFEQPTKFELVLNLKTAKTLGLAISRDFLSRVDEVIE